MESSNIRKSIVQWWRKHAKSVGVFGRGSVVLRQPQLFFFIM